MARSWNEEDAEARINKRLDEVREVKIKDYVRDTDLTGLANGVAYRVDGAHMYVDILNMDEMLGVTAKEGVVAHRRTLRFLNLHYRAARKVLLAVDAIQVDFHNQRLHAVFAKPYGDEAARIHRAIATAQLLIEVLAQTGEEGDNPLPAAKVRVGIDSGKALAVNNGRRGNREPLFLGPPANLAAKRSGGGAAAGIFLTNTARDTVGLVAVANEDATKLSPTEVETSEGKAKLGVTVDEIVKDWEEGITRKPIGAFVFAAHTPPYRDLDLEALSEGNSRRQDAVSIYADIDGFTDYVSDRIAEDSAAKNVVKALHVLRGELDAVLHEDFAGRKIRFIGDCVHGVMVEGTAQTTDAALSAKNAMLCAAAMRSSFKLALDVLEDEGVDAGELGLAIGLEYGPMAITRLGVKGEKIRCCISRSVLESEIQQLRCAGDQTAIGDGLAEHAPAVLKDLFGASRRARGFDYAKATETLSGAASKAQVTAPTRLLREATPAAAAASVFSLPAQAAGPSRTPAGFA